MALLEFKLTADAKLIKQLKRLADAVEKLARYHKPAVNPLGRIEFRQAQGEISSMSQIFVTLPQLPADNPESADVVKGELTLVVNGGEPSVIATELGQAEVSLGDHREDTALSVSFCFVDDAGLRSVNPLVASYVVSDTTPPPDAVSGLGFRQE